MFPWRPRRPRVICQNHRGIRPSCPVKMPRSGVPRCACRVCVRRQQRHYGMSTPRARCSAVLAQPVCGVATILATKHMRATRNIWKRGDGAPYYGCRPRSTSAAVVPRTGRNVASRNGREGSAEGAAAAGGSASRMRKRARRNKEQALAAREGDEGKHARWRVRR